MVSEYRRTRVQIPAATVRRAAAAGGDRTGLCMKLTIMLFDEPTSALDPEMIARRST